MRARNQKLTQTNLRVLLKEKGFTQTSLADALGITYQQVQKYCSGQNEMSLKTMLETCKYLNVNPVDIYPEIELYDKGFFVPKTKQSLISQEVENLEDIATTTGKKNITINNNTTNHIYKSNFFENFFSNIRLLDVNSKGALLFKIAVSIIILNYILYLGFRTFGFSYAPFIGGNDHLGQLMWDRIIFTYPMSFILPLLIRHWLVYILPLITFGSILRRVFDIIGLTEFAALTPDYLWYLKTFIALILTLIYAWIVKTYLRKPTNTKTA
ncbi:MAG: helix-turn-helix domain-containing protein [Alphaproteobacteria bacterium]|jgi:transcriptional regulator with XRE-family HTH domain|nr:helix-turn-helix domain-containing protein [Alphaproteobacteria bacterium]